MAQLHLFPQRGKVVRQVRGPSGTATAATTAAAISASFFAAAAVAKGRATVIGGLGDGLGREIIEPDDQAVSIAQFGQKRPVVTRPEANRVQHRLPAVEKDFYIHERERQAELIGPARPVFEQSPAKLAMPIRG